ncbi:hypothetical protein WJX84_004293 [Apatococcus fuscideae]|uniref:Uncharacterized protein n=1 Tax=Apatococcus fuscideae TaxID=2026836 RepID=A0AAW1T4G2_9CHLO
MSGACRLFLQQVARVQVEGRTATSHVQIDKTIIETGKERAEVAYENVSRAGPDLGGANGLMETVQKRVAEGVQTAEGALKEAKEAASNTADTFVDEVYHSSGLSQQQGGGRQPNRATRDRLTAGLPHGHDPSAGASGGSPSLAATE